MKWYRVKGSLDFDIEAENDFDAETKANRMLQHSGLSGEIIKAWEHMDYMQDILNEKRDGVYE